MSNESWRPVVGSGHYEVSDLGRVRSWRGPSGTRSEPKVLRQATGKSGHYMQVSICDGPGLRRTATVHILVLEAFVCPRPDGLVACHVNGDAGDNRLSNLRWGSDHENAADRRRHGTWSRGERHGATFISDADALAIFRSPAKQLDLARAYGVSRATVCRIKRKRSWLHIHEEATDEAV